MSDYAPRTLRQRLIALLGVSALVGTALLVLWLGGVFDSAGGEAAELVDTPKAEDGGDYDVGPLEGDLAPDFEISDFDGDRHRLSDYRGKVVYLNFWATWCVPCQAELPEIYSLDKEYGDDLVVIAINKRETLEMARDFFDNLGRLDGGTGVSYDVNGRDPDETLYNTYHTLPIDSLPISVFIDPRGVVSTVYNGQLNIDDMREAVEKALAAP